GVHRSASPPAVARVRMLGGIARRLKEVALRGWRASPATAWWPANRPDRAAETTRPHVAPPVRDVPRQPPGHGTNQELHDMSQVQTEAKPVVTRNQALGWLRQV